jgi:hypothetical protein
VEVTEAGSHVGGRAGVDEPVRVAGRLLWRLNTGGRERCEEGAVVPGGRRRRRWHRKERRVVLGHHAIVGLKRWMRAKIPSFYQKGDKKIKIRKRGAGWEKLEKWVPPAL